MTHSPHNSPAPKKNLRSAIAKLQTFFGVKKKTKTPSPVAERHKERIIETPKVEVSEKKEVPAVEEVKEEIDVADVMEEIPHTHLHLLQYFPAKQNLLNGAPITITLDNAPHIIAFRAESIILDSISYALLQNDDPLDVQNVMIKESTLTMSLESTNRHHKVLSLAFSDDTLQTALKELLKRGTTIVHTENTSITISRF